MKKVTIMIPRVKGEKEDVFVSVNLDTYLIKRGVPVEVPESVKEVLDHQQEMYDIIEKFENQNVRG